jgi:hypothetical protein
MFLLPKVSNFRRHCKITVSKPLLIPDIEIWDCN